MSDTKNEVAGLGNVQRLKMNQAQPDANISNDNNSGGGNEGEETEEEKAKKIEAENAEKYPGLSKEEIALKIEEEGKNKVPELSEVQLKALFKETFGEDFDGDIDSLKAKLKKPAAELTQEEKDKEEAEWDKLQLQVYLDAGGTIENYAALKAVAAMDLTDLSKAELSKRMKKAGFDEDEIEDALKIQFFQHQTIDQLIQDTNETDAAFEARKERVKKLNAYGSAEMQEVGKIIKGQADATLRNLRQSVVDFKAEQVELAKQESQILSTVDEVISKVPKKITFELGKINNIEIAPVEHEVKPEDIAEVTALLKDPATRNKFTNSDGTPNIQAIADLEIENRNLKRLVKVGYVQGDTRAVEFFRQKFPFASASDLGLGSANRSSIDGGGKGVVASSGPVQRVKAGQS